MARRTLQPWFLALVLAIGVGWGLASTGITSSNDGSHIALARALGLRGRPPIDPEVALTLGVDRARKGDHWYSDRPPGTAFLALPATWLGAALDEPLWTRTVAQKHVILDPAGRNYVATYLARSPDGPPLARYQGTALAMTLHAVAIGLLGILVVDALLRRREVSPPGRAFVATTVGLGSLWGPYATTLFSHGTAGTMVIAMLWSIEWAEADQRRWRMSLAGLCGGWAVAADYLVLVLVVPLAMVWASPRRWPWLALGAVPVAVATAAYHQAAFGSPWAIGYDFHANFEFARSRIATFDGDVLAGLWTLWGMGRDAGVAALSPVMLAGVLGLGSSPERRWLLAALPWVVILALHHTPWGGATDDHRYLVPLMPVLAVGLGRLWQRIEAMPRAVWWRSVLVVLAVISAIRVWLHLLAWRG